MKALVFVLLLCLTLGTRAGYGSFVAVDTTIGSQTEDAVLIVAGKVSDIRYVDYRGRIYTDVTLTVSKTLKGQPNIDKQIVRFRIEGGPGWVGGETVSGVRTFNMDQELILFFYKRETDTLNEGLSFYDGLYPFMSEPYPEIVKAEGKEENKIVRFSLYSSADRQGYALNIPVDIAFRLIENAIKAPEDVAVLEEKVRRIKLEQWNRYIKDIKKPIKRREDLWEMLKQWQAVEPEDFLLMLDEELTKIETKIKDRENKTEQ